MADSLGQFVSVLRKQFSHRFLTFPVSESPPLSSWCEPDGEGCHPVEGSSRVVSVKATNGGA